MPLVPSLFLRLATACTLAALLPLPGLAQPPQPPAVQTLPNHQWILSAGETSYALGINEDNQLQSVYWGPRLAPAATLPAAHSFPERSSHDMPSNLTPFEYPAWGAGLFTEPALKVDSPNGDRTLVLVFDSASSPAPNQLEIILKDKVQPIRVHLLYQLFPEGILARWSRVENAGKAPFTLEQAASATWNLPNRTDYTLSWLTGQWGAEFQLHTEPLATGAEVYESRRGSTSHQANPWFAIAEDGTTESNGPVWFGELAWSGSWRFTVEHTPQQNVRITGGYNPFDFAYTLKPGESLETPKFFAGYTAHGQGEASRILHRFQLAEVLPTHPDPKPRPIIYNSWEATGFNVSEAGQIALADKAAKLGVERFVIDDGWFGERKDDHAGLGDWYVNPTKFPHGLKPVIDHVHSLGMDFGLWVEPEMVNPDSDLYRKHPDWVMNFPDRQRSEARNQLVLNLARPDVRDYVFNWLDKLVTDNDIAFLKWDYNRSWSEPGWPTAPGQDPAHPNPTLQKEIYVRFVDNLYGILRELRAKHPHLEIESCSSGGGRVDLGILRYTDEVWPSDNTDALDRLSIQDGFTHAYTPETMAAWVTDVPNFLDRRVTPLHFRFLVAMGGALGIGGNLNHWTPEEMSEAKDLTAFYKTVRTTVQHGDLFRLLPPTVSKNGITQENESSAIEYVAPDGSQAVLFSYLHSQRFGLPQPAILLQGLDPTATYRIHPLDPGKYSGPETASGSVLMGAGIPLHLRGDYDSTALTLTRLP